MDQSVTFRRQVYGTPRETFSSRTCIAMEGMVSIQVQLENVSLGVL